MVGTGHSTHHHPSGEDGMDLLPLSEGGNQVIRYFCLYATRSNLVLFRGI